ncbi:MAG: exodeoxyribonuclease VII small subunit [Candidatus Promineifilaceae bacterium]
MSKKKSDEITNLTFEEALYALEETVASLEAGDFTLEESLALFERGQKLAAFCNEQLENASLRVEQLTAEGELAEIVVND